METESFESPVTRYYIDTRSGSQDQGLLRAENVELPLIETLPQDLQSSISRYLRSPDRFMSLGSALLKYFFIHRSAKIPWSDIRISKTPKPHCRPYWDPPRDWHGRGFEGLEFNISHQAGMVVLVGCHTPTRPHPVIANDADSSTVTVNPNVEVQKKEIRVGVDVACTREPRRTPDLSTQEQLDTWVDTFAEMFSTRERADMKNDPIPIGGTDYAATGSWDWDTATMDQKARRFYTYWALKEAYIKMVGEGLLADWLRDLEFVNVLPPQPGERFNASEVGMQVLFNGKDITNCMDIELEALEDTYLLATMIRGIKEPSGTDRKWKKLDIERDIKPCAEGTCACLT